FRKPSSRRETRACSAETAAARLWSSQKPGALICCSSSSARPSSDAGSKVLPDPVELGPELVELLRERSGVVGHGRGMVPGGQSVAAHAPRGQPRQCL